MYPKMYRNLISLNWLISMGCRWSHENHLWLFGYDEESEV